MKLCFVTREYPPVTPYTGGIGTQFAVLASELGRQGHDVHVLTVGPDASGGNTGDEVVLHLLDAPRGPRPIADRSWSRAVDRALRTLGRFDVVYAAEWGGDAAAYSRRKCAGPLVTNLTSSYVLMLEVSGRAGSLRGRVGLATQGALERGQAERSDAIVACSRAILTRLQSKWDIDRVPSVVLPNTLDVARTRALAAGEPPPGFPATGPVVAFSGRLETRKGVEDLVQAMAEVWRSEPDAQLVMLGGDVSHDGVSMAERLERTAGAHRERLHLLGHQPAERLFPALAEADVVAMPSRWEPFGIAALETMALARPTVLTTGSGFEEFAEPGADSLLVRPGDPAALAEAILRLLRDEGLRRTIGTAAALKAERYDAPIVARQHAEFFGQIEP